MARYISKHTGKKIDDTIDNVSNPNLLDNWYFGNPVNQRGQTTYTGEGYTIDRWCGRYGGDMTAVIRDGYIEISRSNYAAHLRQYKDMSLAGKTVTVSALCSKINMFFESTANGVDYTSVKNKVLTGSDELSMLTFTLTVPNDSTGFCIALTTAETNQIGKIASVKLELGSTQTLAHQENGVWVLNEIPDYGEQLARCQRYQIRMKVRLPKGSQEWVDFPTTMRTTPSIEIISSEGSFTTAVHESPDGVIADNTDTEWSRTLEFIANANL